VIEDNILVLQIAYNLIAGDTALIGLSFREKIELVIDVYNQLHGLIDDESIDDSGSVVQ